VLVEPLAEVSVPPVLIVMVKPLRELAPMNELSGAVDAIVMAPPLLILIAVAPPNPAEDALVPPDMVMACAALNTPLNDV
jgi:hypothetical protein